MDLFLFFTCRHQVRPVPFVEDALFLTFCAYGFFIMNQVYKIYGFIFFSILISLTMLFTQKYHVGVITIALWYRLKSEMKPPEVLLLYKIVVTILSFFVYQMKLTIIFLRSVKELCWDYDENCTESVDRLLFVR